MNNKKRKQIAYHVSFVSILVNTLLSLGKIAAGLIARSSAMISDGIHSASDVLSTFVVIAGIKLSCQKADKEHEYGHEKMECLAALLLGTILFITALTLGYQAIKSIININTIPIPEPGILALIAAAISIIVKEWMFWFTRSASKKIDSPALMADAWHHRSDALSSVATFIGIFGARLGFVILDPIASLCVCFFIIKASYDICKEAVNNLTDKSCGSKTEEEMRKALENVNGVYRVDNLKTRQFGPKAYVDVEISADASISFVDSHAIAENAHVIIESHFPQVKHCMVHISPVYLD